ncbi:MAG: hypothetical protein JWL77_2128 [Chthonomonadaceae bacterium]|nr:hypothetical protein [Chthonomonadaceae bacterium]
MPFIRRTMPLVAVLIANSRSKWEGLVLVAEVWRAVGLWIPANLNPYRNYSRKFRTFGSAARRRVRSLALGVLIT